MFNVRLTSDHLFWENAVYLAVAGDVNGGDFFVLSCFPGDVLDEIYNQTELASEGFPT